MGRCVIAIRDPAVCLSTPTIRGEMASLSALDTQYLPTYRPNQVDCTQGSKKVSLAAARGESVNSGLSPADTGLMRRRAALV